jgi:hypothetical protein
MTDLRLQASPPAISLAVDGTRLIASREYASDKQPFATALDGAPSSWSALATPDLQSGAVMLVIDSEHRVLYSANFASGLWRYVLP